MYLVEKRIWPQVEKRIWHDLFSQFNSRTEIEQTAPHILPTSLLAQLAFVPCVTKWPPKAEPNESQVPTSRAENVQSRRITAKAGSFKENRPKFGGTSGIFQLVVTGTCRFFFHSFGINFHIDFHIFQMG